MSPRQPLTIHDLTSDEAGPGPASSVARQQYVQRQDEVWWPGGPSMQGMLTPTVQPGAVQRVVQEQMDLTQSSQISGDDFDDDDPDDVLMASQLEDSSASQGKRKKIEWSRRMVARLLALCKWALQNGLAADNGFKSAAWTHISKKLSDFCGFTISKDQCQSKWQNVKKPWTPWLGHLASTSGWVLNEMNVLVTEPEVMDRYYEKHPDRRQFRHRRIDFENELDFLLGGRIATGRYARDGPRTVFNEDVAPAPAIALSPAPESHVCNRKRTADEAGVAEAIRAAKRGKKKKRDTEVWEVMRDCNEALTAGLAKVAEASSPKGWWELCAMALASIQPALKLSTKFRFLRWLQDHRDGFGQVFPYLEPVEMMPFIEEAVGWGQLSEEEPDDQVE